MQVITYTIKKGVNTRQPLRVVKNIEKLIEIAEMYWRIMEASTDPIHRQVWNSVSKSLPKKTVIEGQRYEYQSAREYIWGFIEKISRSHGNDISERQCWGFENFSSWFANEFGTDAVVFRDANITKTTVNLFD